MYEYWVYPRPHSVTFISAANRGPKRVAAATVDYVGQTSWDARGEVAVLLLDEPARKSDEKTPCISYTTATCGYSTYGKGTYGIERQKATLYRTQY